jgi:hypothetical protein
MVQQRQVVMNQGVKQSSGWLFQLLNVKWFISRPEKRLGAQELRLTAE